MIPESIKPDSHALLIIPFIEDYTAYSLWHTPLGMLRLAGMLREKGLEVTFIDLLDSQDLGSRDAVEPKYRKDGRHSYWRREIEPPEALKHVERPYFRFGADDKKVMELFSSVTPEPDYIFIASGMTYWYESTLKVADLCRHMFGKKPLFTGGIAATLMPELFEQHGLHVIKTAGEKDVSPAGYQDLLNRYEVYPAQLIQGCYYNCEYCSSRIFYPKMKFCQQEHIAESIKTWHAGDHKRDISFYDDALLLQKGSYLKAFLEKLPTAELRFHTPNGLHLREITPELASVLFESNFPELRFGFETVENHWDNKAETDLLISTVKMLKAAGFTTRSIGIYLLCGLPGQRVQSVEQSIAIVEQAGARPYLSEFSPVPGTALFDEHYKESKLDYKAEPLYQNNTLSSLRSPVFNHDIMRGLKEKLQKIYRLQDKH